MLEKINAVLKNINYRLVEIRNEEGLTQDELSEKLEIPLRALQYWEAGRTISLRNLIKVAVVLNRNPIDFFKTAKLKKTSRGRPRKKGSLHSRKKAR